MSYSKTRTLFGLSVVFLEFGSSLGSLAKTVDHQPAISEDGE